MGFDRTPIMDITLELWAKYVCSIIEKEDNPVILMGHRRGGLVCSQACEYCPDKIEKLVYLASTLVKPGDTFLDNSLVDGPSPLLDYVILAPDGLSVTMRLDAVKKILYHDCSDEDIALAKLCLCPEPLVPVSTPVQLTEENYWHVPKVYISTLQDQCVYSELQKKLYQWAKCERVFEMNTSHSPFFSTPDELVKHLLSV